MGEKNLVEGAKEIVIGALVVDNTQGFWTDVYMSGGFVDSINPSVPAFKMLVEAMLTVIVIALMLFGIFLLVRGMKTALTDW